MFAIAGLSDGIDGWLAKTYGWQTRLGGFLDPAGDKLLVEVAKRFAFPFLAVNILIVVASRFIGRYLLTRKRSLPGISPGDCIAPLFLRL